MHVNHCNDPQEPTSPDANDGSAGHPDHKVLRASVRLLAADDQEAFVAASRISGALHHPWIKPPCDTRAFRQYIERFDGKANRGFVIVEHGSGEIAGVVNLTNVVLGCFRSGYLSYFAFSGYERRGLMTLGLRAVVRRAFNDLKLHRLEANIQPANVASIALVRKCGFRKEGYSPAYLKVGGRWRDHERWALVRDRRMPPH